MVSKNFFKRITPLALVGLMAGCYPIGPEYVEDYDVVYTAITEPGFDFEDPTRTTYFLADSVMDLSEPGQSPNPVGNQSLILQEIEKNMTELGYTRITDTTKATDADYLIIAGVNRANNYYYSYWYGWGGWYGWGYWGYGGCCYYPPVTTVSNIRTGTLIVQMIDARRMSPSDEKMPTVWLGLGEGLYEGTASNINSRGTKAINQMYTQSPYLKR